MPNPLIIWSASHSSCELDASAIRKLRSSADRNVVASISSANNLIQVRSSCTRRLWTFSNGNRNFHASPISLIGGISTSDLPAADASEESFDDVAEWAAFFCGTSALHGSTESWRVWRISTFEAFSHSGRLSCRAEPTASVKFEEHVGSKGWAAGLFTSCGGNATACWIWACSFLKQQGSRRCLNGIKAGTEQQHIPSRSSRAAYRVVKIPVHVKSCTTNADFGRALKVAFKRRRLATQDREGRQQWT